MEFQKHAPLCRAPARRSTIAQTQTHAIRAEDRVEAPWRSDGMRALRPTVTQYRYFQIPGPMPAYARLPPLHVIA